jgi:peptidyl-prolyl cis-trans isomerase A (cyclophilin A)
VKRSRLAALVTLAAAVAASCGREETKPPAPAATASAPAAASTPAPAATTTPSPAPAASLPPLRDPSRLTEKAPEHFRVRFETTKGPFVIEVTRAWAPRGADRFYNLVRAGYYDDVAFFRVIDNFMVQFGINGDPAVNRVWQKAQIQDDPVTQSNKRGMVTYATAGPGTRTTQLFINFKDNAGLDGQGFAPFGRVVEGLPVVDSLYSGYGEGAPSGRGPEQGRAQDEGNAYLKGSFPKLDFVKTARVAKP